MTRYFRQILVLIFLVGINHSLFARSVQDNQDNQDNQEIASLDSILPLIDLINPAEVIKLCDYNGDKYVEHISYFEDAEGQLTISDIIQKDFVKGKPGVQNMGVTPSVYWFKVSIHNDSERDVFALLFDNSLLNHITIYKDPRLDRDSLSTFPKEIGKFDNYSEREALGIVPEFHLEQEAGTTMTYFIRVETFTQMLVPLKIMTPENARYEDNENTLWHGIYFGVMFIMIFYNLFLYFSVRDRSYLYYVLYVLAVALVQLNVTGIGFKYLWPNSPEFERLAVFIFPSLTAVVSILFVNNFLHLRTYASWSRYVLGGFLALYAVTLFIVFFVDKYVGYNLINANASPLAIFMIGVAAHIYRKHKYRPAGFFLISWTTFLIGIICFVMKDYGVLPYNKLTVYAIQIGSAIEVLLLSFALADRINILQAQNRANREAAFRATEENARIIREQNVLLEQKVEERTAELQQSNQELERTLNELKDAQSQLVESEKMASLGQLTAGIAHEINNPINFVTSNVTPLKRDIVIMQDLIEALENLVSDDTISTEEKLQRISKIKEDNDYDYLVKEIDYLLQGIAEGALRTSEIVKGLRLFSRLDEDDVKRAELQDGLDSTIAIINHMLNGRIEVIREYGNIPAVECFPGKLNQVFLNMMSNAIHAIQEKWGEQHGGQLTIRTFADADNVYISIADNGSGMSEDTKKKLFEPFYTTKDVGVGTGLGLSIAWNTIRKHNGSIQVDSEIGVGTTFIMAIPIRYEAPKID